jgi:hypothetical protein
MVGAWLKHVENMGDISRNQMMSDDVTINGYEFWP